MSASASSSSQQWTRRTRYADEHLRVSDAERNAVTERLSAHYADGRLDQAEFDERVARAMSAKTRGDLAGLFDDLPDPDPLGAYRRGRPASRAGQDGPAIPYRGRRRGPIRTLFLVAMVIFAVSVVGHAVASFFFIPWLPIVMIAAIAYFAIRSSRR
jgi:hypothetical protein